MSKKPHPHLEDPKAAAIHREAWGLWGNKKNMAAALGVSYAMLWRRYSQGLLPPDTLHKALLEQAVERRSLLSADDLLWFNDRLRAAA